MFMPNMCPLHKMSKQFPILLQTSDCLIFTFLDSLVEKGWFGKKNVRNSSQYVFSPSHTTALKLQTTNNCNSARKIFQTC